MVIEIHIQMVGKMKQFVITFVLISVAFVALTKAGENVDFDLNSSIEFADGLFCTKPKVVNNVALSKKC